MKNIKLRISITKKIVAMVTMIVLFICTVTGFMSFKILNKTMTDEIEKQLAIAAFQFDAECFIDGVTNEQLNHSIQNFKDTWCVDVTIFDGDTRAMSTIPNVVGTKMDVDIIDDMEVGFTYFSTDANVNGTPYFGYYLPITINHEYFGAIFTGIPQQEAKNTIMKSVSMLIFGILICGVIAIITAILLTRAISNGILDMQTKIKTMTDNDLSIEYDKYEFEQDEIAEMCNQTIEFAENLRHIIDNIKNASSELGIISSELDNATKFAAESSSEIAKAVEEVANGAVQQAEETNSATSKISDMSNGLGQINNDVVDLHNIANSMDTIKNNTSEALHELQKVNDIISSDISSTNDQVNITNQSVYKIRQAVDVIQDIASQTKLLSLNASIEAARAGDSGKGFAVVAENIRVLADQSAESSNEINSILEDLFSNYERIIQNVQNTTNNMVDQNTKLSQTQEAFNLLESNINEILVRVSDITNMVDYVNREIGEMVDVISNLSAISEENSASAEQTMASIEELNSHIDQVYAKASRVESKAEQLLCEVNIFKTE